MIEKVENYLSEKKNIIKPLEIAEAFQILEQLYTKKLWHQLGNETEKLVYNEEFLKAVNLKEFYDNFIIEFEHRINVLQLIQIVLPIAKAMFKTNPTNAYEYLNKFKKAVDKNAAAYVRLFSGLIELHLNNKKPDGSCVNISHIHELIKETEVKLNTIVGVTSVHAPFYKVKSVYLKEIGDYAGYYREALRYLGCEDLSTLSLQEQVMQATLLGFAALLGKNIYNFGELLAHPIIASLKNSPENWLYEFLIAFNAGDLKKFYEYEKKWSKWPDMVKHRDLLESKIRLLCLMEIAMTESANERQISFAKVSEKACVKIKEVEFLVMKALSNDLIRGSIDQVNQVINVTWVQPRVLSLNQIVSTVEKIEMWRKNVIEIENLVAENAKEIIVKT